MIGTDGESESQGNLCCHRDLMMLYIYIYIYIYIYTGLVGGRERVLVESPITTDKY